MSITSLLGGPLLETAVGLFKSYQEGKLTKEQLSFEINTLEERHKQEIKLAQIDVNREEAKGNWFQAGWRPLMGYVCVLGFTMNFLVIPVGMAFGLDMAPLDLSEMMPVLLGMLGLGGLRTFEKTR